MLSTYNVTTHNRMSFILWVEIRERESTSYHQLHQDHLAGHKCLVFHLIPWLAKLLSEQCFDSSQSSLWFSSLQVSALLLVPRGSVNPPVVGIPAMNLARNTYRSLSIHCKQVMTKLNGSKVNEWSDQAGSELPVQFCEPQMLQRGVSLFFPEAL